MATVKQLDKRSGITYVYESISYWDKEKKQPRSKRKLIGRLDPSTGDVIPTDGRGHRRKDSRDRVASCQGKEAIPQATYKRKFYGATYLLDRIAEETGISDDLKECFPSDYKKILSIAYFLVLEAHNSLSRFSKWERIHRHPYGENIPSQRSSELFQSITEEAKDKFFTLQGKRRIEKEYWAYDTTSISSYSEQLRQVRYGKNKDGDALAQINLALLFGERSGMPFYYRKLAGNIPDVKTIRHLLQEFVGLGYRKVKLILDRGFYSKANVNGLYQARCKFLMSVSTALSFVKKHIEESRSNLRRWENYNHAHGVYQSSKRMEWNCAEEGSDKKECATAKKRMHLHLYYDPIKAADDESKLNRRLAALKEELLGGNRKENHEASYRKYFQIKETPARGIQITAQQEVIDHEKERFGYFALISNDVKDPSEALSRYRNRDMIEKAFDNVKDQLNCRRLLVSSEQGLDGKLFVEFIALIFTSYIKKKMSEQKLFEQYTLQGLLDDLDVIECFERPGHEMFVGEVLKPQEEIYIAMGVKPPPENPSVVIGN